MVCNPSPAPESLHLTWPKSVDFHSDITHPIIKASSTSSASGAAAHRQTSSKCETYNDIPLRALGEAQELFGDEIRLLDLHPGEAGMPLIGEIRKVRLSGYDVYEPLSYTWEDHPTDVSRQDDVDLHPCLFLKENHEGEIKLQTNCAKALSRIRYIKDIRTIWVDSICINQKDPVERSQQVALMGRIYARPHTVIAYVGHRSEEHHSHAAMSLLRNPKTLNAGTLDERQRSSIDHFVRRPYFQRMWIVQECSLATSLKLICGPDEVDISNFTLTSLGMLTASKRTAIPAWLKHSVQTRMPRQKESAQARQLLDLILDTAACECADAKDRIFALLSLLGTGHDEDHGSDKRLVADYSLSVEQVYSGIAAFLVANGLLGAVLTLAGGTRARPIRRLPSWVPDWSQITIGMRETLPEGGIFAEDNTIRDLFSNYALAPDSSREPEGAAKAPNTGIGSTRLGSNGVITVHGLLLDKTNDDDTMFQEHSHPRQKPCTMWTVCVPARDFSIGVDLRKDNVDSEDHVFVQRWASPYRRYQEQFYPPNHLSHRSPKLKHPLTDSERLLYAQMLPQHLRQLTQWSDLWTNDLTAKLPFPRLKRWVIDDICKVQVGTFCTLRVLWQKWKEQAPLGQAILKDESQVQLVSNEITKIGTLGKVWKPACRAWLNFGPGAPYHHGDDFGGFVFASFLSLFMEGPLRAMPKDQGRHPDTLQEHLSPSPVSRLFHWTKNENPLQHLMDWAETTFALLWELQNKSVEKGFMTLAKLTRSRCPVYELWMDVSRAVRHQDYVAKRMCEGYEPEQPSGCAIYLLDRIRRQLLQMRGSGPVPNGHTLTTRDYWDWTIITDFFSPTVLRWISAETDQDREKVMVLRKGVDDYAWAWLMNKLELFDEYAELGINLVDPEFVTFAIV